MLSTFSATSWAILAIDRRIRSASIRTLPLSVISPPTAPPVNTNQGQGFHALHILCYFMGDPGDRPAHPIRIHQDLAALCHLASHSLLLKSPSSPAHARHAPHTSQF